MFVLIIIEKAIIISTKIVIDKTIISNTLFSQTVLNYKNYLSREVFELSQMSDKESGHTFLLYNSPSLFKRFSQTLKSCIKTNINTTV